MAKSKVASSRYKKENGFYRGRKKQSKSNHNDNGKFQETGNAKVDSNMVGGDSVKQDPSWHVLNPELKRLVAALPYGEPVGAPWTRGLSSHVEYYNSAMTKGNVPGIVTLLLRPSIGDSSDVNSPVNVASWALYSSMRRVLAGSFTFDPVDCSIYCIGAASIYSAIVELQRVYGVAYSWKQENRYVSRYIVQALGFNADDIFTHLADFEYGINLLISKARAFYTPKFMPLYAYHAWLYRDIYSEGIDIKDQMYAYIPDGYFQFGLDNSGAGCLKFTQIANRNRTVQQALNYVNTLINQFMLDEDATTISSLLKKAYGEENAIILEGITPAYTTSIVAHNDYILHQFKNATVYPASYVWGPGSGDIVQDESKQYLTYSTKMKYDTTTVPSYGSEMPEYSMFLYETDNVMVQEAALPSEDMAIESTRNMSQIAAGSVGGTLTNGIISSITGRAITGTTICTGGYIWWMDGAWTIHEFPFHKYIVLLYDTAIGSGHLDFDTLNLPSIPMLIGTSKSFKYIPEINVVFVDVNTSSATKWDDIRVQIRDVINLTDYDNFTIVDENELRNIHEVSIMTELGVLGNGTIN